MTQSAYIPLGGGMDLVTPPRQLAAGRALYALNYECPVTGGYRRIDGYTQVGPVVPGEEPLLGVCSFADDIYAIRKDVGSDSATLYQYNSSTDAWDTIGTGGELTNARHEFAEGNFLATAAGRALYLVGGGKPFELKGGALTELANGPDGGVFIAVHRNHLFIGFEVGSVQHSSLGDPADWNASTGSAGEVGTSEALTGMVAGRGGVLHLLCRDSIKTLYGSSSADWELRTTIPNSGAKAYSGQAWLDAYYVAERGISSLQASDQFGDFQPMQSGAALEPVFTSQGYADRITCSVVSKRLAQYRVFFDDGTGVYLSPAGMTLVQYPDPPVVAHGGEQDDGTEVLLFGTDAGEVMQLGGNTFNGETIAAFLTLAYTDLGKPTIRKRFRRVFWDIRSGSGATIRVTPDFDFGNVESGRHGVRFLTFLLGGGLWDVDDWGEFAWSTPVQAQDSLDIAGTGTSINFAIYSEAAESHELLGYDLVLTPRRLRRG